MGRSANARSRALVQRRLNARKAPPRMIRGENQWSGESRRGVLEQREIEVAQGNRRRRQKGRFPVSALLWKNDAIRNKEFAITGSKQSRRAFMVAIAVKAGVPLRCGRKDARQQNGQRDEEGQRWCGGGCANSTDFHAQAGHWPARAPNTSRQLPQPRKNGNPRAQKAVRNPMTMLRPASGNTSFKNER